MHVGKNPSKQHSQRSKMPFVTSPVLAHFNVNYETLLSADSSSYGLGAILLQKAPNEDFRPVAYISRALTPTESRYSQIEKEALVFYVGM